MDSLTCLDKRDNHIIGMFEVVLSTIDSKMKRVENLDRAVHSLMHKMESLESKSDRMSEKVDRLLDEVRRKLDDDGGGGGGRDFDTDEEDMFVAEPSIQRTRVYRGPFWNSVDRRLNVAGVGMRRAFPGSSSSGNRSDTAGAPTNPESRRKGLRRIGKGVVGSAMSEVKEMVNSIDRRLGVHINIVSENMGKMTNMVKDVHGALMDEEDGSSEGGDSGSDGTPDDFLVGSASSNINRLPSGEILRDEGHAIREIHSIGERHRKVRRRSTKIDRLLTTINPLNEVRSQVEEVRGMLAGTKDSVDHLVPRSEELLTQTQRQERAISNAHLDLTQKANRIIEELSEVERGLTGKRIDVTDQSLATSLPEEGDYGPTLSTTAALIRQNVRKSTIPTVSGVSDLAVEKESSPGAETTSGVRTANDEDLRTSDSLEEEMTTRTPQEDPKGPSGVIFPSVENKPNLVNTSLVYDSGRNLNGNVAGFSCADLYKKGLRQNGIYYLQITGTKFWYLKVFCDMETVGGGWTVIQRRDDYGLPRESFHRDWDDYKYGFGRPDQEVWLGNENIHLLTRSNEYEMRVELEDFDGNKRFAQYGKFGLGSEKDKYRLEIGDYQGDAGDSLNDPWYGSNMRPFSTYNNDNDRSSLNCASMLKGGWWWKSCGRGLNGLYMSDPNDLTARQGIVWFRWKGWDYTLKRATMMIRPTSFAASTAA